MQESKMRKSLDELKDEVVAAACRWKSADIYVHPVLSRADAVKVGCADLIQNWENARITNPAREAKSF